MSSFTTCMNVLKALEEITEAGRNSRIEYLRSQYERESSGRKSAITREINGLEERNRRESKARKRLARYSFK